MRPAQRAAIARWVRAVQPAMQLGHWTITVEDGWREADGRESSFAGSFIRDYADVASLYIGDLFWTETPAQRRQTLVHELVHLHLYRLRSVHGDILATLGQQARQIGRAVTKEAEELAVERLAAVIAPYLPLCYVPD